MTVLLIDASGHKRQMEIQHFMPVILVPLQRPISAVWSPEPPVFEPLTVAEFVFSDEPSFPPVYRQRLR